MNTEVESKASASNYCKYCLVFKVMLKDEGDNACHKLSFP